MNPLQRASALVMALLLALPAPRAQAASSWPAWDRFCESFVQDDGRVVDWTSEARSTSEGQAYGLFFALVANDRAGFARLLEWTRANLADGDLSRQLPAWLWGRNEDAQWRVLDPNPASDADLWIAYSLLEAGRLWKMPAYQKLGSDMLALIAKHEVRTVDRAVVLLPGPAGFETPDGLRLNPSYIPPFQFEYLARVDPKGPWQKLLDTHLRLMRDWAPSGAAPDWYLLTAKGPRQDSQTDGRGSYDAIRVYLWAGMTDPASASEPALRRALAPFTEFLYEAGRLPERWYPDGHAPQGLAPAGLEAAMLPFHARYDRAGHLLDNARTRLAAARSDGLIGQPARYYEQILDLFGTGWLEHHFRFDREGRLRPQWLD